MKKFAFISENNKIHAIIAADSYEKLCEIPGGNSGIELPENSFISVGWSLVNGEWILLPEDSE